MKDIQNVFDNLKDKYWHDAKVTFYAVGRTLSKKKAKYSVKQVKIDREISFKLKGITSLKISSIRKTEEFNATATIDNRSSLAIEVEKSDFQEILDQINSESTPQLITSYDELLGTWFYVAKLSIDDDVLYSARKVSDRWTDHKVRHFVNMMFKDNTLVDLEEKEIFRLDGDIDFVSYNDYLFITQKKNFELMLNFKS